MDKGKGGKGKKWTSWPREVGTYPYLKNIRKGLHHQLERCLRDLQASPDPATACFVDTRLRWILAKQDFLAISTSWSGTGRLRGTRRWSMEAWSPPLGVV